MRRGICLLLCFVLLVGVSIPVSALDDAPLAQVSMHITPSDAQITVSSGIGYTYTQDCFAAEETEDEDPTALVYKLEVGAYTATVTAEGYYAATLSFEITQEGTVKALNLGNAQHYIAEDAVTVELTPFTPSANVEAWDGVTLDVSWYDEEAAVFYLAAPAQLAGMAAIVNGIYNAEITTILDDQNRDGTPERYTPTEYAALAQRKIRPAASSGDVTGPNGSNLVTTDTYWYGVKRDDTTPSDFNGKTVYLTAELDMGGYQIADGKWTGARYMPIGGQYLMHYISYGSLESDGYSHLGASFNGKLDGQGHTVKNLYCDRYAAGSNFGDSSTIGLVGRLGTHDNDPAEYAAVDPTVRNLAVSGYVYGRRSVGGIVGKIGQTTATRVLGDLSAGGIIENCMNYATVHNTDAKGCGGIVGAGWNDGIVRNCANFGTVYTSYRCPTGGISGSNEVPLVSCYNAGKIYTTVSGYESYAMAIGTNNGGASTVTNCYWLTGSASGGYYSGRGDIEITDDYNGSGLSAEAYMKTDAFTALLCGETRDWVSVENDYPIPRSFIHDTATVVRVEKAANPNKLAYIDNQSFDPEGLKIIAYYSDGTQKTLQDYTVSPETLHLGDTAVTVSGTCDGIPYSYVFPITMIADTLLSVQITTPPTNTLYASNEEFSAEGMLVSAYFAGAPEKAIRLATADYTWTLTDNRLEVSYTVGGTTAKDSLLLTILDSAAPKKDTEGFYLLGTQADMLWFANQVNALSMRGIAARLTADIVSDEAFSGIGTAKNQFAGRIDGQGFTLTLQMKNTGAAGLLAYASGAGIHNLTIDGSVSTTGDNAGVGAFAGYVGADGLTVADCKNLSAVTAPAYAGGFVGKSINGTVSLTSCTNSGTVTATANYGGGLLGYCAGGLRLSFCENSGAVFADGYCGGIAGCIDTANAAEPAVFADCRNTADITAEAATAGGIAGYAASSGETTAVIAERCSNEGAITAKDTVGGLFGSLYGADDRIIESFNLGAVTAGRASGGVGGIVGICKGSLSCVYSLGAVSCTAEQVTVGIGGIAGVCNQNGQSMANVYSAAAITVPQGAATGGVLGRCNASITLRNCYYEETDELANGIGQVQSGKELTGTAQAVTATALKTLALPLEGFLVNLQTGYHGGYPLLRTELSEQQYVVKWVVDGKTAEQVYPAGALPQYYGATEKADDAFYTYSFAGWQPALTGVSANTAYTAQFSRALRQTEPDGRFSDVLAGAWYYAEVYTAAGLGLVNGVGNGRFSPDTGLTRAMLVQLLFNAEGCPTVTADNPFTDVKAGSWYERAVLWASEHEIVGGVGNGCFNPDGVATREQLATILYRYAGYLSYERNTDTPLTAFPDCQSVSGWAEEAMRWAVATGMIRGNGINGVEYLLPRGTATRAQAAAILLRFLRAYL